MKHLRGIFLVAIGLSTAQTAISQDYTIIENGFKSTFHSHYEARHCGRNILSFLQRAEKDGFDLQRLSLVTITNKGFTVFGMVNAEMARGSAFNQPVAGESNWYHHVIAVDDRSYVYDFDFGIRPTILPINEYMERMFLIEDECKEPRYGEFCAGADKKLKEYEFEWTYASDAVREESPEPYWTSTMEEGIEHYSE